MNIKMANQRYLTILCISLLLTACATPRPQPANEKQAVRDVIPVTMANLRGHQSLYREGWFVITSSEEALDYAREKSIVSSRQAMVEASQSIAEQNSEFADAIAAHWQSSLALGKATYRTGTNISSRIFDATSYATRFQVDYGIESFRRSWYSLLKGSLYLGERTRSTRQELMRQPGHYFDKLDHDFTNIYDITKEIQQDYSLHIGETWENAYAEAKASFEEEYRRSGESSNSLTGLLHIFSGYGKGIYRGVLNPGATTIGRTANVGARGAAQAVFLPTATAISVSGRTVEAIGMTVFYSGKLGVEIISPTIEAGLLSGLAILSLGSAPITYVTGTTMGAINQVAFTAASPAVTAGSNAVLTAAETGKYVSFVAYDSVAGASKVVINQAQSAVVLGYNALTALPAHLFMGAIDSVVFLAYDGPRLVLAYARGNIKNGKDEVRIDSLPVGSVVDLDTLRQQGASVDVLSDDPTVIQNVLEKLPDDLRQ